MKARFDIQAATKATGKGERPYDLYLYGYIGEYPLTGQNILQQIAGIDPTHLTIYIHSPGGSVFEGASIYSQLERLKTRGVGIDVVIDGLCASMASVIAMIGDTIKMHRNGMMMIHNPWMITDGDWEALKNMSDMLLQSRDQLLDIYYERTGIPNKRLERMMRNETWMRPEEALAMGFIDGIIQSDKLKTPEDAAAMTAAAPGFAFLNYQYIDHHTPNPTDMSLKAIVTKALGMSGDPSETDIENRLNAVAKLEADNKALEAKVAAFEKAQAEKADKAATELVDTALAEGRIDATDREKWLGIAKNDLEFAQKQLQAKQPAEKVASKTNPTPSGQPTEDRSTWSVLDWSEKDPKALEAMQQNEPERFKQLEAAYIQSRKGAFTK